MIRVYADMAADLFHYGHMAFLEKARGLGDYLLVGVHSDEALESYKRERILTMEERVAAVAGCRWVDEVLPDAPLEIDREWIEKHDIHIVAHGDDSSPEQKARYYKFPIEIGIFHTLPYTMGISTTEIIARCQAADRVDVPQARS